MKITFNNENIMTAMSKVEMTLENSMSLTLYPKDEQSNYICCFSSANTNAQVSTHTVYSAEPEVTEPQVLYFGKDFKDTICALISFNKDIIIEVNDKKVNLSSGPAKVTVKRLETASTIPGLNPANEPDCIGFEIKTEAFQTALRKGGCACGLKDVKSPFDDVVCLKPDTDGTILFLSTNGHVAASWNAKTEKRNEKFSEFAKNAGKISISGNLLGKIFNKIDTDVCNVFLFSKQVLIQSGMDFYQLLPLAVDFPLGILNALNASEYSCKFTVDRAAFTKAIEISVLNGQTEAEQTISKLNIGDRKIIVSSVEDRNVIPLETSVDGELEICARASYLQKTCRVLGDKIIITGTNSKAPLFLTEEEGDGTILVLPVNNTGNTSASKADEKSDN